MECEHIKPKQLGLGISRKTNKKTMIYQCKKCGKYLSEELKGDITNKELYALLSKDSFPWHRVALITLLGLVVYDIRGKLQTHISQNLTGNNDSRSLLAI